MRLADCYRVLGLREGSSFGETKSSYRRLARQYHPDANPDNQAAHERFVRVAEAYQQLMSHVAPTTPVRVEGIQNELTSPITSSATSEQVDQQLKRDIYHKLQELLRKQRFPRAIALVEALAQRLPGDSEVRQWQAITYQRWAQQLAQQGQPDKARVYLKKALPLLSSRLELTEEIRQTLFQLEQQR